MSQAVPVAVGNRIARDQIQVLELAEGFFQSCVLFALLRLRIFELIGKGTKTAEELAASLHTQADVLERLLNAGVVFHLLESLGEQGYRLSALCRSVLLPSAGEAYLGDWIRNLDYFRDALSRLDEAVLKAGPTVDPAAHLGSDEAHTREFTLAMHNYAAFRGLELARYLDTSGCQSMLDLGCGPGTYAFNLGAKNPRLKLYLMDLPGVLSVAKEVQFRYQLENEIHYLPVDVLRDEIPNSYDIVLVSNTLHMLGEEASIALIRRLHRSVNPGGSLVIQAQYLRDDRMGERWPILLDLIQLCITRHGRNHTVEETRRWLEDAGFSKVEFRRMSLLNTNSFVRAYK